MLQGIGTLRRTGTRPTGHGLAAGLLSFSSFFVFPALPLGRSTGLAVPYVIAALLVMTWLGRLRRTEWVPLALMIAPLMLSTGFALLAGDALAPDVMPKLLAMLVLTFTIVVPTRYLLRVGYRREIIGGAAVAAVVHALAGAVQIEAFERYEFPFKEVFASNPGMGMPVAWMETYVLWVKRPFGLFAEPSAMAACIGPWLVVFSMALFSGDAAFRLDRRTRALLLVGLSGGLGLVVLSRSGQAVPITLAAATPAILSAFRSRMRASARWAVLLSGVGIVGGASIWLTTRASDRFSLDDNASWQLRLESLRVALAYLLGEGNLLFGVGPGQSVPELGASTLAGASSGGVTAIWSVTLTYAMETGFIGVGAMLAVAVPMMRSIWRSTRRLEGMICAGVWFFGVLLGTSYVQQPALWMTMAALLSWRELVGDRPAERDSAFTKEPHGPAVRVSGEAT